MTKQETIGKLHVLLAVVETLPDDADIINANVNYIRESSVFLLTGIEKINRTAYVIHDYTKESVCVGMDIDGIDVHQLYDREKLEASHVLPA